MKRIQLTIKEKKDKKHTPFIYTTDLLLPWAS